VDCVTAGFPCQPWSLAGRRRGKSDERWIWPEIARIVREVGPGVVFVENVPGLIGDGLATVLGDLAGLGYDAEWGVLGASEVGAPHRRRRIFILAHADLGWWRASARGGGGEGEPVLGEGPGGPGLGGGLLADTGRIRVSGMEPQSIAGRGAPTAARRAGAELADAVRDGSVSPGSAAAVREGEVPPIIETHWRAGADLWPPGPDDGARWNRILARWPELAPATQPEVCGVADGVAGRLVESVRTDRLHLLGNGVVPLAAALAFRILLGRALGGGRSR
jgi:DNA (cytosine-5)-methyltransferase 1